MNIEEKVTRAREYFLKGHACSQAVAAAFHEEMGLTEEEVFTLTLGFGGGFGGMREVCGCVSGMTMVLSRLYATDGLNHGQKKELYETVRRAAEMFTAEFGTIGCRQLLISAGETVKAEPRERTPAYYRERPCVRYVEYAAQITAQILQEKENGQR